MDVRAGVRSGGPVHVLVIDDDEELCRAIVRSARSRGSRSVVTANNSAEARACARQAPVDVAIVDWILDGESGLDLVSWLRRECPYMRITLASAQLTLGCAVEAMRRGADDCVEKPYTLETVLERLERAQQSRLGGFPTAAQHEWCLIKSAMHVASGNKSKAARLVGVTRNTLVAKLKNGPPR